MLEARAAGGSKTMNPPDLQLPEDITETVTRALAEDVGGGDLTGALIPAQVQCRARVVCREAAILCGSAWFDEVFRQLDGAITVHWHYGEGAELKPDSLVCNLSGPARALLTGERSALNFLQLLSGVATQTRRYVDAVRGYPARILDTRKTLPGLRLAQKYAVCCGGGLNHRLGLYDRILIKENHIRAAGGIAAAIGAARRLYPGIPIEIEVENPAQIDEALAAGAERLLLDNFDIDGIRTAVQRVAGRAELEASGGVDLASVRAIAATGIDYISIGALTKNVRAVDFSMRFVD
jgi:nicotinate-nucleotide pyrophosphorylase (carboxylating)